MHESRANAEPGMPESRASAIFTGKSNYYAAPFGKLICYEETYSCLCIRCDHDRCHRVPSGDDGGWGAELVE